MSSLGEQSKKRVNKSEQVSKVYKIINNYYKTCKIYLLKYVKLCKTLTEWSIFTKTKQTRHK